MTRGASPVGFFTAKCAVKLARSREEQRGDHGQCRASQRRWVPLLLMIRLLEVKVGGAAFERFVEVRAEVFDSLEPDRDAQEAWVRTGLRCYRPVSYTHLTLPTNREV